MNPQNQKTPATPNDSSSETELEFNYMPDIKDSEGKVVETPDSQGFKNFADRFSAAKNAPPEQGGDIDSESNQKVVEQIGKESEQKQKTEQENKEQGEKIRQEAEKKSQEKKGPGSNVPRIIEEKRAIEKERDELKVKHTEFESTIATLQAKIDSGDFSAKKEQEFQLKIESMETQMKQEKDSLVNENARLKSRLTFHDVQEDPEFQDKFIKPVVDSYHEAVDIVGADEKQMQLINRALIANSGSLNAKTQQEKVAAERERDSILSGIVEDLGSFSGQRFAKAMTEYISNTQRHANALKNHEETNKELREKYKEKQVKEYAEQLDTWSKLYTHTQSKFTDESTLSDEEKTIAKELNLDIDKQLKESEKIAKGSLNGSADKMQAVELIHAGRVRPVLMAKIAIRDKRIKDLEALVVKLRGSGTGDGNSDGSMNREKIEKPKDMDSFLNQFRGKKK